MSQVSHMFRNYINQIGLMFSNGKLSQKVYSLIDNSLRFLARMVFVNAHEKQYGSAEELKTNVPRI